jgi:uncharacterized secreted protein with C-terminal beta-propeller domain
MRKTVALVAAGAALAGMGVAAGWAAGAAGHSSPSPTQVQTATAGLASATSPDFRGQLVAFDSCSALLDALHARARAVVGPYGFGNSYSRYGGLLYDQKSSSASLAPSLPQASAGGTTSAGAADSGTLSHSTTNTQVAGVDEPDVAKTDGRYLISLDGQLLHIVDVRTSKLRATLALPQPGTELLLAGDHVVILSGQMSGYGNYPVSSGVAGAEFGPAQLYPSYGTAATTLATVVDISNADAPKVTHRWTFNAGEIAARVVNGTIRLVLSSPPPQETWTQPRTDTSAEKSRATKVNQQIVDATPLDSWVPRWTGDDGQSHPLSACDAVAAPTKPSSLSMVTVVSLDPGANQPSAGTSVLGAGTVAYAEGQHLFVSDTGTYLSQAVDLNPQSSNPTIHLLEFDLTDPAQARYLASGSVPGQLHDSYALSEYQDHLRVTTTTTKNGTTSTGVSVLGRQGDRLVQVGSVSGLGTGEQVYAVRYAGDRGYVVTFQRIDPLHVIDLSNPVKPVLRGTLSMTGYSSLLLPLSGDRLLGIGRAVTSGTLPCVEACPEIVEPGGLQLSLFDVSDAAHPKLLDRQVLSDTYATAVNDPHAVTLSPDGKLVVLPSTSGPLAITVSATKLATTTGAFTTPYSVQDQRTVIAGDNLFELADRGVAVRALPGLHQTGWISF